MYIYIYIVVYTAIHSCTHLCTRLLSFNVKGCIDNLSWDKLIYIYIYIYNIYINQIYIESPRV